MLSNPDELKLYEKLVSLMAAIESIEKRGEMKKNDQVQYKFIKASDLLGAVHEQMVTLKLLLKRKVLNCERWTAQTHSGGTLNFIQVHIAFRWIDAETGAQTEFEGIGCGMDSGDKAPQKALLSALKYGLRDDLLVPDDTVDGDQGAITGEEAVRRGKGKTPKRSYENIQGMVTEFKQMSKDSLWLQVNGVALRTVDEGAVRALKNCMGKRIEVNAYWDTVGRNKRPCMTITSVLGVYAAIPGETQYEPVGELGITERDTQPFDAGELKSPKGVF